MMPRSGQALILPVALGLSFGCILAVLYKALSARAHGSSDCEEAFGTAHADAPQDVARRQQGSEGNDASRVHFLLSQDVWERIWEHLSVADLVRMSAVCKEWRQSIRIHTAARRAALAASVEAPDSVPDQRLSDVQLALRWLKRVLLLHEGWTGPALERDTVFRFGCSDEDVEFGDCSARREVEPPSSQSGRGNCGRDLLERALEDMVDGFRGDWWKWVKWDEEGGTEGETLSFADLLGEMFAGREDSEGDSEVPEEDLLRLEEYFEASNPRAEAMEVYLCRRCGVFGAVIMISTGCIMLHVERVPDSPSSLVVSIELYVEAPWSARWMNGIVLGMARGIPVRIPCAVTEAGLGPLASSVELRFRITAIQHSGEHWALTLPGRESQYSFLDEWLYVDWFVMYHDAAVAPL